MNHSSLYPAWPNWNSPRVSSGSISLSFLEGHYYRLELTGNTGHWWLELYVDGNERWERLSGRWRSIYRTEPQEYPDGLTGQMGAIWARLEGILVEAML